MKKNIATPGFDDLPEDFAPEQTDTGLTVARELPSIKTFTPEQLEAVENKTAVLIGFAPFLEFPVGMVFYGYVFDIQPGKKKKRDEKNRIIPGEYEPCNYVLMIDATKGTLHTMPSTYAIEKVATQAMQRFPREFERMGKVYRITRLDDKDLGDGRKVAEYEVVMIDTDKSAQ